VAAVGVPPRPAGPVAAPASSGAPTPAGGTGSAPGIAGRTIVLDPGHGDHSGAHSASGAWEDDDVLAIAQRAATLLRAQGATVRLTRAGPHLLGPVDSGDLTARVAEAVAWQADVFVSLHQNRSTETAQRGVQTFYATADSRALAAAVQRGVAAATGLKNLGLAHRLFWVVSCNPMPAVLVEGGFLSNPAEAALISSPAFFDAEARGLTAGLEGYFAEPGAVVGAHPLPARLATLCAMDPVQARTWITEHYQGHRPPAAP
jgi:N-acetylmuramoyl-L-alanine amidase